MHVQLLSLFFGNIILDDMRFPVIQLQGSVGTKSLGNAVNGSMDGPKASLCEIGKLTTAQGLFGIGVGGILASADLFGFDDNVITLCRRQTDIGNINVVFFRNCNPAYHYNNIRNKTS